MNFLGCGNQHQVKEMDINSEVISLLVLIDILYPEAEQLQFLFSWRGIMVNLRRFRWPLKGLINFGFVEHYWLSKEDNGVTRRDDFIWTGISHSAVLRSLTETHCSEVAQFRSSVTTFHHILDLSISKRPSIIHQFEGTLYLVWLSPNTLPAKSEQQQRFAQPSCHECSKCVPTKHPCRHRRRELSDNHVQANVWQLHLKIFEFYLINFLFASYSQPVVVNCLPTQTSYAIPQTYRSVTFFSFIFAARSVCDVLLLSQKAEYESMSGWIPLWTKIAFSIF